MIKSFSLRGLHKKFTPLSAFYAGFAPILGPTVRITFAFDSIFI